MYLFDLAHGRQLAFSPHAKNIFFVEFFRPILDNLVNRGNLNLIFFICFLQSLQEKLCVHSFRGAEPFITDECCLNGRHLSIPRGKTHWLVSFIRLHDQARRPLLHAVVIFVCFMISFHIKHHSFVNPR